MTQPEMYQPRHHVRIVSAAALFDGHDAAINVMRRIMQATGAEVIHLGHNRSVEEVAMAAIQEDAQGVAITSYQGGHLEYFKYLRAMLTERGAGHIRIYGGGGGVIVPREIEELHGAGIDRIFSPEDGRALGLQGMINMVIEGCDFDPREQGVAGGKWHGPLARRITEIELGSGAGDSRRGEAMLRPQEVQDRAKHGFAPTNEGRTSSRCPVIGLTGTGGAGKSSLTDELVRRFLADFPDKRAAVLCVDPTRRKTGGALLGDRIRFNSLKSDRAYLRSLATRTAGSEINSALKPIIDATRAAGFDLIFVETAGIGQGDSAIADLVDVSLYVMTSEYGAPSQLEKIEMLDYADFVVINKFTRRGSEDALRDVRKQYQRNHARFNEPTDSMPVFGTSAAHFNDSGVNHLYAHIIATLNSKFTLDWDCGCPVTTERATSESQHIIPPGRERYLSEISDTCREYQHWAHSQADITADLHALTRSIALLTGEKKRDWLPYDLASLSSATPPAAADLMQAFNSQLDRLDAISLKLLRDWPALEERYSGAAFTYAVRDREFSVANYVETLSGTHVRKVARPRFHGMGDRLYWRLMENVPGEFPYTAGVFPFKREFEDPTRMFAGEGPAERTNQRFHLLAAGQPAVRLSTAFDSITLYGENPGARPDIYGKIGESGVSLATVEEMERLYAGFDLCCPTTSVSMTINGPAPAMLAFFMNTATRQRCRAYLKQQGRLDLTDEQVLRPDFERGSAWADVRALLSDEEYARLREEALQNVRGTVQADILKEDQGQNTCIFSTEFALRMMGDVQQYFIDHDVRNYYSVSISGYHIAEAGANPIHQLAFTLANGFTYVEYYLARGMDINRFAPNLSFFFSNGMDAEYSVIGRVARRIWAVALARKYGADARSQMLKYHIQTSGRSLHAQEIEFNDIRTTLQALLATYDNAQSLHTNAYDEAITTPTEESVRRAMAVQLIINREFGLVKCENATQGSFIIEELTDLVEEAVLKEFDRLSARGGVLGAMELQYQRGEIQSDSLKYEHLKHSGGLPLIGVNTFLPRDAAAKAGTVREVALTRASAEEKQECIARLEQFHSAHAGEAPGALAALKDAALSGGNVFAALLDAAESLSLGQITQALYEVGGEYRRNV